MAKQFMDAVGNPIWIDPASVEAVGSVFSDGTPLGESEKAKQLTRIYLKSGVALDVDAKADFVAGQIFST